MAMVMPFIITASIAMRMHKLRFVPRDIIFIFLLFVCTALFAAGLLHAFLGNPAQKASYHHARSVLLTAHAVAYSAVLQKSRVLQDEALKHALLSVRQQPYEAQYWQHLANVHEQRARFGLKDFRLGIKAQDIADALFVPGFDIAPERKPER